MDYAVTKEYTAPCFGSVDRIEKNIAVILWDDGRREEIPAEVRKNDMAEAAESLREGDIVRRTPEGICVDREETARRWERAEKRRKSLFRRD